MLKKGLAKIILPLVLLTILPGGAEGAGEPAGMVELRRIYSKGGIEEAWDYLDSLPAQSQREVARLAADDADKKFSYLGITALVQSGHLDEAVPALSAKVAGGDDLTRFGYALAHDDDPFLCIRLFLKLGRYLLAKLDKFKGEQRINVERFLSNMEQDPLVEFSPEAVQQSLARIETRFLEQEKKGGSDENRNP